MMITATFLKKKKWTHTENNNTGFTNLTHMTDQLFPLQEKWNKLLHCAAEDLWNGG